VRPKHFWLLLLDLNPEASIQEPLLV
jgi:hypothetical protein